MTFAAPAVSAYASLQEQAYDRLNRALGADVAARYQRDALDALKIEAIQTPNDLLGFADYLVTQGGVPEAVGRALRVTALLRGAGRTANGSSNPTAGGSNGNGSARS